MLIRLKDGGPVTIRTELDSYPGQHKLALEVGVSEIEIILYYVREGDGFKIVEQRPTEGPYGVLSATFELEGMMGGPAFTFRELPSVMLNELLATSRKSSGASLDIQMPEGIVTARDGVGDWTKFLNISERQSVYAKKKSVVA